MLNEILNQRLQGFAPEYRDFIMSDFTEVIGTEAQSIYGLSDEKREVFENMLFLHITLFLNRIEFMEAVALECSLSIIDAINLVDSTLSALPPEMLIAQQESYFTLSESNEPELVPSKNRLGYIETLPQQKLAGYLYVKTNLTLAELLQHHNILTEELLDGCRVLLGDIFLGFYKIEDTVPLLQQELGIDAKTAALLGVEVLDLLAPLSNPNWQPPVEVVHNVQDSVLGMESTTNSIRTLSDQVSASLPELRTMAADMAEERSPARTTFDAITTVDEPVYVSTQPTIEKKIPEAPSYTAPLYEPPKPNLDAPLEKPRWG